jgi:hypothetical protein
VGFGVDQVGQEQPNVTYVRGKVGSITVCVGNRGSLLQHHVCRD